MAESEVRKACGAGGKKRGRATPMSKGEMVEMVSILERKDYDCKLHTYDHPNDRKNHILEKVIVALQDKYGEERTKEQIQKRWSDLKHREKEQLDHIHRILRKRQKKQTLHQSHRKGRRDETSPQPETQEETEEVLPVASTPSKQPEQIDVESQEDIQPSDAVPGPSCPVVLRGQTSPDPRDHDSDESGGVPVFCPNHTFPRCTIGRMSADILQCCKELEEIKEAATALQHRMGYLVDMLAKF